MKRKPEIVHDDDEDATEPDYSDNEPSVLLTPREYEHFKEIVRIGGATPLQVGLVKAAVVGVTVFAACFGFILALFILRYIFNRWFDAHIYDDPQLSTVVVTAIIVMLGIVVYGAVAG